MRHRLSILAFSLLLGACASMAPPERPPYTGADTVSTASSSQLLGTWQVRELNPIADAPEQRTEITYQAGGKVIGTVIPAKQDGLDAFGDMQFEVTADWTLTGDILTHANVNMRETTGNKLAAMMTALVNQNSQAIAGSANIYELSADRMVLVGEDGAAMEYLRID